MRGIVVDGSGAVPLHGSGLELAAERAVTMAAAAERERGVVVDGFVAAPLPLRGGGMELEAEYEPEARVTATAAAERVCVRRVAEGGFGAVHLRGGGLERARTSAAVAVH